MAQAQPCIRCEAGESAWALTARDDSTGMEAGTTLFLCNGCWVTFVLEWAEAVVQASPGMTSPDEPERAGPAEPDVTSPPSPEMTSPGEVTGEDWEYAEPEAPKRNGKKTSARSNEEQGNAQAETATANVDQ